MTVRLKKVAQKPHPQTFLAQPDGYVIPAVCSGSVPSWTCPENLYREAFLSDAHTT